MKRFSKEAEEAFMVAIRSYKEIIEETPVELKEKFLDIVNTTMTICNVELHHFKNNVYDVHSISLHTEDGSYLVNYSKWYEDVKLTRYYSRPWDMFGSKVDKIKYPEASQDYRFEMSSITYDDTNPAIKLYANKLETSFIAFMDELNKFDTKEEELSCNNI